MCEGREGFMQESKASSHEMRDDSFERFVLGDADFVKPILRENLLKSYIYGTGDALEAFRLFCGAFSTDPETPVRMVLFSFAEHMNVARLYTLNEAERRFDTGDIILSAIVAGRATFIVRDTEEETLMSALHSVCDTVKQTEGVKISAVYSRLIPLSDIQQTFGRLWSCKEFFFYSDNSDVICEDKVKTGDSTGGSAAPSYTGIAQAVQSGDEKLTKELLCGFFDTLERSMPPPALTKTYCLELYVCIIRNCDPEMIEEYMKGIDLIQRARSLGGIRSLISERAAEIASVNRPKESIYSQLVKDTLRIIDENISNEKLSLRWIAKNHLFTNVDYLGKVFKKEVGKNFSHYVMEKRMELAKELIMGGKRDRIYEVAERLGYGSNSQYFSQVFKKYTGRSPLEYKESVRLTSKQ